MKCSITTCKPSQQHVYVLILNAEGVYTRCDSIITHIPCLTAVLYGQTHVFAFSSLSVYRLECTDCVLPFLFDQVKVFFWQLWSVFWPILTPCVYNLINNH